MQSEYVPKACPYERRQRPHLKFPWMRSGKHTLRKLRKEPPIVSYQTHPQWLEAFRANGFQVLQGRRVLALSPSLERQWGHAESLLCDLHMNTIDGDGPLGLAPAGSLRSATYSEQPEAGFYWKDDAEE